MTKLEHVTRARIPARALSALAGLRRLEGVSVAFEAGGERAWVAWPEGEARVLRAVLPIEGVELFELRGDGWHRPGDRLALFDEVPGLGEPVPLARAVTPEPFVAERPDDSPIRPVPLRLGRGGRPRAATAVLCPMAELARWADSAPSASIERVRGALGDGRALLLGRDLPSWPGSARYWGERVLIPIGFEVRPGLPEPALLDALDAPADSILRVTSDVDSPEIEVESIPLAAFRPLSRAGVRLAGGGWGP